MSPDAPFDPEAAAQLAALLPLLSALIVSRLRRWQRGRPKITLPLLCAGVSLVLSYLGQLVASLVTGAEVGAWQVAVGWAFGGVSLLGRQVLHELSEGETIDPPGGPTLADLARRPGRRPSPHGLCLVAVLLLPAGAAAQTDEELIGLAGELRGLGLIAALGDPPPEPAPRPPCAEDLAAPGGCVVEEGEPQPEGGAAALGPPAQPVVPAVTLRSGSPVYYAPVGFGTCTVTSSSGPPSPWSLPGATLPGGQLDLAAPGVCDRLRRWNAVGCGSLHSPWRQTCADHGHTVWCWDCAGRRWVLCGSRCGLDSIAAAFLAAFGRPWLGANSEERLAAISTCGLAVGCSVPGCPPPQPSAPPSPEPCVQPGPPCGNGSCEPGESPATCPVDCGPVCGDGVPDPGECPAECPQDCGSPEPPADPVPPLPVEPRCCTDLGESVAVLADRLGSQISERAAAIDALAASVELLGSRIEELERRLVPPDPPVEPPTVPPVTPGWERLHASPAGWSWSAPGLDPGTDPETNVLRLAVRNTRPFRAVRLSYTLTVPPGGWDGCQSMPGPGAAPKCLGTWLVLGGRPASLISYLIASRGGGLDHRYGFGVGQEGKARDRAGWHLLPGTYRVMHEARAGAPAPFALVAVTGAPGAAAGRSVRIEGGGPCRSRVENPDGSHAQKTVPCYPGVFPAERLEVTWGWRGDLNTNEGAMRGWQISDVAVDVQR